jgi:hypothetical protein
VVALGATNHTHTTHFFDPTHPSHSASHDTPFSLHCVCGFVVLDVSRRGSRLVALAAWPQRRMGLMRIVSG